MIIDDRLSFEVLTINKRSRLSPSKLTETSARNKVMGIVVGIVRASREENQLDRLSDAHATDNLRVILYKQAKLLMAKVLLISTPEIRILEWRGVAQLGSAGALGALGRRFESCRPDWFHDG